MNASDRIERTLASGVNQALEGRNGEVGCPRGLAAAIRHAVFPGGARVRPRLCLSVAAACGEDDPRVSDGAAVAIELLHCASLVHDDLPCFDDAVLRRGRPSVHAAFGERLAILAGDALIVLAFQALGTAATARPERHGALLNIVGRGVGAPSGIVAGQAWECEPEVELAQYHRAKTGALFVAATAAGAAATGADPRNWNELGQRLGEAYQVADDIQDVIRRADEMGKPAGRDAALGRPSAVAELGVDGALRRLAHLIAAALESVPRCRGANSLRTLISTETRRLVPKGSARRAA